jgi:putative ABC transport system substrate-binding protein
MRRRDFIKVIGSTAVAWPLAARAQRSEEVRRIGVLMNLAADTREGQANVATFHKGLLQLGWRDGDNVRIHTRWGENDIELDRKYATELVGLAPDAIVAAGTLSATALQRVTRSLPIVFVDVSDPIGAGLVDSLAKPGGNVTGFMIFEYGFSGKWLELLKQIVPSVTRVAVLRDFDNPAGIAQFGAIRAMASSLGVDVTPINVQARADAQDIERAVADFARSPNAGLIVTGSATHGFHGDLIITLAARYKLPAVYSWRPMVAAGGLISYAPDQIDQYRHAAGYVDRILKGEKPANLPVQAPTKYQLVINLKTAKSLAIEMPASVLARADEVIE